MFRMNCSEYDKDWPTVKELWKGLVIVAFFSKL